MSSFELRCSTVLPLLTAAPAISCEAEVMPLPSRLAPILNWSVLTLKFAIVSCPELFSAKR